MYVYKKKNMAIYSFTYIEVAELYALSLPFDPIIFLRKRNTLLFDKIETNRSFNLEWILFQEDLHWVLTAIYGYI